MIRMETLVTQRASVLCAFCGGTGRDPFGIMSALSTCCVCGGTGSVSIKTPYIRCAFCHDTGVYPRSRQTCTACGGAGVIPVHEPNETCPRCLGTGADPQSGAGLYCLSCHGTGVVEEGS